MSVTKEIFSINSRLNDLNNGDHTLKSVFNNIFASKDKIMFTDFSNEKKSYTYGEIEETIYIASEKILATTKGKDLNSWVIIHSENTLIWVVSFWAALLSGYRVFLLNPKHLENNNLEMIKTLDAKYVIGDTPYGELDYINIKLEDGEKHTDLSNFANEVAMSSSGSSLSIKIAVYSGAKIIENLRNFGYVISKDHNFMHSYKGQLSHLVILPFYHVFGFTLVFLWYSFANGRFVLPKDLTTQSVLPILKDEHITLIFSVPIFFEKIYEAVNKLVVEQKKEKQFTKLISFNNKLQTIFPRFGSWLVRNVIAASFRKKTLGKDVVVLGSGGGPASEKAIQTLNGLGYRLINGYGTTELSIFLAAYGVDIPHLNKATIGNDTWRGEYFYDEKGELSLKLPTCCDYVIEKGKITKLDSNEFIKTGDIGRVIDGYLYIDSREDDLLVLKNGEKVYPQKIESYFTFLGVNNYRIISYKRKIALIVYVEGKTNEELYHLYLQIKEANKTLPSTLRVQEIRKTNTPLPISFKQEVNRKELTKLVNDNIDNYPFFSSLDEKTNKVDNIDPKVLELIKKEVATVLNISDYNSINIDDDFFMDLGGESLSYMELTSRLNNVGYFDGDKVKTLSSTTIKEIAIQFRWE